MISATTKKDIIFYFLLNVSSAFLLSAAHNVLYFVLDLKTILFHFLHYFLTFIFLLVLNFENLKINIPTNLLKECLLPPFFTQLIVCFLTARVHSGNRTGSLYLLRIFDFLSTITAIKFAPKLIETNARYRSIWSLMLPLTISASMSWLEFGHIEYDGFGLFLAPMLAIAQGINIVTIKKSMKNFVMKNQELSFGLFSLYHTATITAALAFPAFISYLRSSVSYDASWESIDYVLMMTSVIFMMTYKFSELWLISNTDVPIYFALEHSKYFAGSIGQWWLQNMAHASVYAFVGKIVFIASSLQFWQNVEILPKRQTN